MNRFWNFIPEKGGGRKLYLDGVIAAESWWGDEITPAAFRADLFAEKGDVTIWLNSPGGDVVAASQIYAMLIDYPGNVIVKIDGLAASAASVIAMAGTKVFMAPTASMMIHNPVCAAIGDSDEMRRAIGMLDAVKESIINAYELRSNLSRTQLSHLMDSEYWMDAREAIAKGFADGMLEDEKRQALQPSFAFSRRAVTNCLLDKVMAAGKPAGTVPATQLEHRLQLLQHSKF